MYAGDLASDPVIDSTEDLRLRIFETIEEIGARRMALVVAMIAVAPVATLRWLRAVDENQTLS